MQLNNSYNMLRFLNRSHSTPSRYALAALGWLGALIATRSVVLANGLSAGFAADQYLVGFRKAAHYARHLSRRLAVFNDPFFDFTVDTTPRQRRALRRFVHGARRHVEATAHLTDLLYIQAADIHAQLERAESADTQIESFYQLADQALALVSTEAAPAKAKPNANGNGATTAFKKANAVQALHDIAELLPLAKWPWYVVSGTFLGLHREGRFLAHDIDIDLGINAEDVNLETLLQTLRDSDRFAIKKLDHHLEVLRDAHDKRYLRKCPAIIKAIHANDVPIDIFIHYTEDGCCWHGTSIHRWENTPFTLEQRELEGVTVNAPADAERYLTENYGDWRTPIKKFDCTTGTPNLVIARNFISLALFLKRYAHFHQHDRERGMKLEQTLVRAGVLNFKQQQATLTRLL